MSELDPELEVAARVAREAAELVREYRGRKLVIESKAGDEPVTDADRAANALIVARLSEAFPDDVILSEEIPDDRSRLGRRRVWMVDPIDGTSDFILGDTGFVVMIGLAIDGRPAVGAVAHPPSGSPTSASPGSVPGSNRRGAIAPRFAPPPWTGRPVFGWSPRSPTAAPGSTRSSAGWASVTRSTSAAWG